MAKDESESITVPLEEAKVARFVRWRMSETPRPWGVTFRIRVADDGKSLLEEITERKRE